MNDEEHTRAFAQHLPSVVQLDHLRYITQHLDHELAQSQRIMKEIRTIFDHVSKLNEAQRENCNEQPPNMVRHEDVSKFLEADAPILLMPDMAEGTLEVDIDVILDSMKKRAEELRKNVLDAQPRPQSYQREFENLDIRQYATTLDQLSKRLANIKLNKNNEVNTRDALLEQKLMKLCRDVNLFTQMVETKTAISECNKNWPDKQEDDNVMYYDNIISKLLAGINEVSYLLKNKN